MMEYDRCLMHFISTESKELFYGSIYHNLYFGGQPNIAVIDQVISYLLDNLALMAQVPDSQVRKGMFRWLPPPKPLHESQIKRRGEVQAGVVADTGPKSWPKYFDQAHTSSE